MNFLIKLPDTKKVSGFCAGQIIRSSKLFSTEYKSKHKTFIFKAISLKCRRSARLKCLNRHVEKSELLNCISDVCRGFRARDVSKFHKKARETTLRWKKVFRRLKVKASRRERLRFGSLTRQHRRRHHHHRRHKHHHHRRHRHHHHRRNRHHHHRRNRHHHHRRRHHHRRHRHHHHRR